MDTLLSGHVRNKMYDWYVSDVDLSVYVPFLYEQGEQCCWSVTEERVLDVDLQS